jgi:hypothetical protein
LSVTGCDVVRESDWTGRRRGYEESKRYVRL